MLQRVDFYVLKPDEPREAFACRLAEKAFRLGQRVWLGLAQPQAIEALDQLLWTFRPESFLPHSPAAPGQALTPERLWFGVGVPPETCDLFINLTEVPFDAVNALRVAEVVDQTPLVLSYTRGQFGRYRQAGVSVQTHKLA